MAEQWLIPDKLCSFDEKVRVELGPQIIELDCTDTNLSNDVTAPHYRLGARDALGRIIRPDDIQDPAQKEQVAKIVADDKRKGAFGVVNAGEKMAVVDWRSKHVPPVWKVYENQETGEIDGDGNPVMCFIKLAEFEDKDQALASAKSIAEGA